MLFPGPSTGPSAARRFALEEEAEDCLLIDMGGTSFDVSTVIGGRVTMTRDGRINGHPTGLAAVEILTLGAGGGSIARVDKGGLLRVGPDSAGAEPGPACYGGGGTQPTVTDAYLALGYLTPDRFLGGRMTLSRDAAELAIGLNIAEPLGLSLEQAARGILSVVNERMINGILEMTVRRGIDPRGLVLVTAGGATGVAAIELARELGIRSVIVPRETSVLCAYGALNADLKWSSVVSCSTSARAFDRDAVNAAVEQLETAGTAFLDGLRVPAERRQFELYASARYPLQVTELEIGCPGIPISADDVDTITNAFHRSYREHYSVAEPDNDVEFVMWRAVAAGITEPTRRRAPLAGASAGTDALMGQTRFYDTTQKAMVSAPMLDPDRMQPGQTQAGPALLVAVDTTVVLPSGATAAMSDGGYLTIELRD
jgi:N-methylhydantoinase A